MGSIPVFLEMDSIINVFYIVVLVIASVIFVHLYKTAKPLFQFPDVSVAFLFKIYFRHYTFVVHFRWAHRYGKKFTLIEKTKWFPQIQKIVYYIKNFKNK